MDARRGVLFSEMMGTLREKLFTLLQTGDFKQHAAARWRYPIPELPGQDNYEAFCLAICANTSCACLTKAGSVFSSITFW